MSIAGGMILLFVGESECCEDDDLGDICSDCSDGVGTRCSAGADPAPCSEVLPHRKRLVNLLLGDFGALLVSSTSSLRSMEPWSPIMTPIGRGMLGCTAVMAAEELRECTDSCGNLRGALTLPNLA